VSHASPHAGTLVDNSASDIHGEPGHPRGPFETSPRDSLHGRDQMRQLLLEALDGLELGAWDHTILDWLSTWEYSTLLVIAGWVWRARKAAGTAVRPLGDASRNDSALSGGLQPPSRICRACGRTYRATRPSSYCGDTCRQRAFRARRRRPTLNAPVPRSHPLDVLYECGACRERLLNERRCETCSRFARRLGLAVTCTSCDEPLLLTELLEQLGLEVAGLR
jgi:hypothetical protein